MWLDGRTFEAVTATLGKLAPGPSYDKRCNLERVGRLGQPPEDRVVLRPGQPEIIDLGTL